MKCRITGDDLKNIFLDLGHAPPSNSLLSHEDLHLPEMTYPLVCHVHPENFYVQVDEFHKAADIFNEGYVYLSSMSTSMVEHARQYVDHITGRLGLGPASQVMEIASNDGYLLQFFKERNIPCIGVEPSKGAAEFAIQKGIETITEFFNEAFARKFVSERHSLNLILGNNVLAHVPDLDSFLRGVQAGLAPDGVATFEFPHILNLIQKTQFDTVYHEHFSYFSLYAIRDIAARYGLTLFDVEKVATHGGSLRIYLARTDSGPEIMPNVSSVIAEEDSAGLLKLETYTGFQARVDSLKYSMLETLIRLKREGARVAAYGAAAKGSTTFNYCGIRRDLVEFVCDRAPSKVNKFLPGCHIPIVPEDHLKTQKPDYIIIIPWNIRDEISQQLSYAREWGAKFITLVPEVEIF
jgi:predicted TPR repeat methyltransferase